MDIGYASSKCTGSRRLKIRRRCPPLHSHTSRDRVLDRFVCFCIADAVQAYRRLPVNLLKVVELRYQDITNAYVHISLPPALQTVYTDGPAHTNGARLDHLVDQRSLTARSY
jgi:hypothetical protein